MDEWLCNLGSFWGTTLLTVMIFVIGIPIVLLLEWVLSKVDKLWFGVLLILVSAVSLAYLIYNGKCGG